MKKRTRKRLSNILYRLFIAILLIVFALCTFQLYVLWTEKEVVVKREKAITEKVVTKDKYLEPDWEALRAQNPDIIGWIYVPDCDINFPLVYRSGDNKRYLSTDASGYYDEYGAIFLDGNLWTLRIDGRTFHKPEVFCSSGFFRFTSVFLSSDSS